MSRIPTINPLMAGPVGAGSSRLMAALAPMLAQQASAGTTGVGLQVSRAGEQSAARRMEMAMMQARLRQAAQLEARAQQAQRQRDLMDTLATAAQIESQEKPEVEELSDEDAILLEDVRDVVFQAKQSQLNLNLDPSKDPDGTIRRNLQDFIDETLTNGKAASTSAGGKRAMGKYSEVFGSRKPVEDGGANEAPSGPGADGASERPGLSSVNPFGFFDSLGAGLGRLGKGGRAGAPALTTRPAGVEAGRGPWDGLGEKVGSLLGFDQVPPEFAEPGGLGTPSASEAVDVVELGKLLEEYQKGLDEPVSIGTAEKRRRWKKASRRR